MFESFALHYFDYITKHSKSLLTKIFGMYEVVYEGYARYYAVMENLFYDINKEAVSTYDLKGSKLNRFFKDSDVGLDTNFIIDFNSEPILMDEYNYSVLE